MKLKRDSCSIFGGIQFVANISIMVFPTLVFLYLLGAYTPESLTGRDRQPDRQAPAEKASGGRLEAMQVMLESLSPQQRGQSVARRALLSACEVPMGFPTKQLAR